MRYSTHSLKDYHLTATDGVVGQVKDIYFDSRSWTVRYLVVNTGAWLLGKEVLISAKALGRVDVAKKSIRVNLSLRKIRGAPDSDSALPVSRQDDLAHHEYYDFPPDVRPGAALHPASADWHFGEVGTDNSEQANHATLARRDNLHLRSAHDVIGHTVQGCDHEIGCVGDFLIDDADWSIPYFIVDTAIWFGKEVVVPTAAIREVSWDERTLYLTISRQLVKHAPEYNAGQPSADPEQRLAGLPRPNNATVFPISSD